MKRLLSMLMVALLIVCCVGTTFATGIEDELENPQATQQPQQSSGADGLIDDIKNQDIHGSEQVGNILSGTQTMSPEQLAQASVWAKPITNIIGYVMGIIIILMVTFVGLITALDLMYIAIPPVRNILYKAGTDGTGAYTGGMNAGGFGMGGYGMGGRRGMGMMGAGGAPSGTMRPTQWVSDEAVACAALLGGSQQAVNMGSGGMGGMGMNGMGMGMGATPNEQVPMKMKSVLWVYIKKRAVFLVLLMVAVMVLTSSALMGTGVNLAQWILKIIMLINGKIA